MVISCVKASVYVSDFVRTHTTSHTTQGVKVCPTHHTLHRESRCVPHITHCTGSQGVSHTSHTTQGVKVYPTHHTLHRESRCIHKPHNAHTHGDRRHIIKQWTPVSKPCTINALQHCSIYHHTNVILYQQSSKYSDTVGTGLDCYDLYCMVRAVGVVIGHWGWVT